LSDAVEEQDEQQQVAAERSDFVMTARQEEFIEAVRSGEFLYMLYGGAIRGGKTVVGLWTLILLCKVFPGSRWAINVPLTIAFLNRTPLSLVRTAFLIRLTIFELGDSITRSSNPRGSNSSRCLYKTDSSLE
jgi:hypothetical protein